MSVGTLLIDEDNDLILAEQEDGAQTIGVSIGASTISQSVSIATSLKKSTVWFSLASGIDYKSIFFNSSKNDDEMLPIRATAIRNAILSVPGVIGLDGSESITFERKGRSLIPKIPCVKISCDDFLSSLEIGAIDG